MITLERDFHQSKQRYSNFFVLYLFVNKCAQARNQGGGHLGHLPPPENLKKSITILTFAETLKK